MTERPGSDWTAAIQAVRDNLGELREQMPLPTIDKSFVDAPVVWRRSEDDVAELVPLYAIEEILARLAARGPRPSQANVDGWFDGIQRGIGDGMRVLENMTTTHPEVIAWRDRSIEVLRNRLRAAARHDRDLWRR